MQKEEELVFHERNENHDIRRGRKQFAGYEAVKQ
jgi:hypothetical protein